MRLGRLRPDCDAGWLVVIEKVFTEVFQRHVGSFPIHEVLKVISNKGLHFFQAEARVRFAWNDRYVVGHKRVGLR